MKDNEQGKKMDDYNTIQTHGLERIVACVNACESIPTEALSDGVVGEMVEVIQIICDSNLTQDETMRRILERSKFILAKLEGNDG